MKKLFIFTLALMLASSFLKAQTSDPELDYIKQAYSKNKKDIVKAYMVLNAKDSAAFWPVYNEYDMGREKLAVERIHSLNEYVANYNKMTNEMADKLGNAILNNTLALDKLNLDYFAKFSKAVGAANSAKYLQLEIYLQTAWRNIIQDELPLVKALDKTQK